MTTAWLVEAFDEIEDGESGFARISEAALDEKLALEVSVETLAHCVIVAVTDRAHRRLDAGFFAAVAERKCLDALLDRAGSGELTTVDVLDQMFAQEIAARRERSISIRLKLPGLPTIKTIEQFEFGFQLSLDERKVPDLHTLRFLANGENIIFLGPPGCGKTHLSITLGYAAITAGELSSLHDGARSLCEAPILWGNERAF